MCFLLFAFLILFKILVLFQVTRKGFVTKQGNIQDLKRELKDEVVFLAGHLFR